MSLLLQLFEKKQLQVLKEVLREWCILWMIWSDIIYMLYRQWNILYLNSFLPRKYFCEYQDFKHFIIFSKLLRIILNISNFQYFGLTPSWVWHLTWLVYCPWTKLFCCWSYSNIYSTQLAKKVVTSCFFLRMQDYQ